MHTACRWVRLWRIWHTVVATAKSDDLPGARTGNCAQKYLTEPAPRRSTRPRGTTGDVGRRRRRRSNTFLLYAKHDAVLLRTLAVARGDLRRVLTLCLRCRSFMNLPKGFEGDPRPPELLLRGLSGCPPRTELAENPCSQVRRAGARHPIGIGAGRGAPPAMSSTPVNRQQGLSGTSEDARFVTCRRTFGSRPSPPLGPVRCIRPGPASRRKAASARSADV